MVNRPPGRDCRCLQEPERKGDLRPIGLNSADHHDSLEEGQEGPERNEAQWATGWQPWDTLSGGGRDAGRVQPPDPWKRVRK